MSRCKFPSLLLFNSWRIEKKTIWVLWTGISVYFSNFCS